MIYLLFGYIIILGIVVNWWMNCEIKRYPHITPIKIQLMHILINAVVFNVAFILSACISYWRK